MLVQDVLGGITNEKGKSNIADIEKQACLELLVMLCETQATMFRPHLAGLLHYLSINY